jgi:hypothetical protein
MMIGTMGLARPVGIRVGSVLEPPEPFLELDVANDPAEHTEQVHQAAEQCRVDATGLTLPIERSQLAADRPVITQ